MERGHAQELAPSMPQRKSFSDHDGPPEIKPTENTATMFVVFCYDCFMTIFDKVKELNLPIGQYVVFGSGPLAAYGIRESRDVDLLITNSLYIKLKNEGWEEKEWSDGGFYLMHKDVEADDSWQYGKYNPSPEEIIKKAEIIEGIPFAPLVEVLKWKQSYGRPKDLADVKLIKDYLKSAK